MAFFQLSFSLVGMTGPTAQRPHHPQRRGPKGQSRGALRSPVTTPAWAQERGSVLCRDFPLRQQTASVMLSVHHDSVSRPLKRGKPLSTLKPGKAPACQTWSCRGRGAWRSAQPNPGPAATTLGSQQREGCAAIPHPDDIWNVLWEVLLPQKGLQVLFPVTATLRPMGDPDCGWE